MLILLVGVFFGQSAAYYIDGLIVGEETADSEYHPFKNHFYSKGERCVIKKK